MDSIDQRQGGGPDDWAGRATATIVGYVDTVRSATTGKALVASRYAVYATALVLIGAIVLILTIIAIVRGLGLITAVILPFIETGEVWLAYLILGGIFLFGGMFCWRRKDRMRAA